MPRERTATERAAGKLITTVQREWGAELGEPSAEISEHVMGRAHELLQASKDGTLKALLGVQNLTDYLGALWVKRHPTVLPAIRELELLIVPGQHA